MKTFLSLSSVLAVILACVLAGCENNSDTGDADGVDGMRIVPAAVHLRTNQTDYVFSVEGGIAPYTWEVGNASLGTIVADAVRSEIATYTRAGAVAGQNTIRVTDSHNTNANQNASWSAVATVIQD